MSSQAPENTENICVVCFKNVKIYSIGSCDHMVCYECSTRMRVLCRQNECPICRQELPKVVFMCTVTPFNKIQNSALLEDKRFKIYFEDKKIQDSFYKLLEHSCSKCSNSPPFRTFQNLYDHMKKQHDLHYCDLCIEHLKIFSSERQCYTEKDLERHKKKGDIDDKSHRGHPLCQFCDVRYMDNDCLYRHLRRDHLYCHFCDADGLDLYYSSYDYLREHFQNEHYLCEEGSCFDEKFTPVFRTEIDLKAHRASTHGRTLGKAAAKQARTLELEFTLKPRFRQSENFKRGGCITEARSSDGAGGDVAVQYSRANLPNLNSNEFPSLPSGSNETPVLYQQRGRNNGLIIHAFGRRNISLDMSEENFPVLGVGNDFAMPGPSMKPNANKDRNTPSSNANGAVSDLPTNGNHRSNFEQKLKIKQDDFPSLPAGKKPTTNSVPLNWASISNKKPEQALVCTTKTKSKTPKLNGFEDFPSLNSMFNANLKLKVNEPSKSNFVNIKTYKNSKFEDQREKKGSSLVPVPGDWSDAAEVSGSSKVKSKKKKSKGNNVEEKSDTAKKKQSVNGQEVRKDQTKEKNVKDHQTAALFVHNDEGEAAMGKPLPKVEDWFEELKKVGNSSKNKDEELEELKNSIMEVYSQSANFSFSPCSSTNTKNGNKDCVAKNKISDPRAPPGFGNFNGCFNGKEVKKPPPGFTSEFPIPNGLPFNSSRTQRFTIQSEFYYTPPIDFEERNNVLVSKVNKLISNEINIDQFRKKSILFRQNMLTAREYYEHCKKAMDEKGLQEVFPELLVLLPDINKQQELFEVYSGSPHFSKIRVALDICNICNQVMSSSDVKQHLLNHSLEQNFPLLNQ